MNGAVVLFITSLMLLPTVIVIANTNGANEIIITHEIDFSVEDLSFSSARAIDGNVYDVIDMTNEASSEIFGSPDLPIVTKHFVIPTDTIIKDVRAKIVNIEELSGKFNILPAQKPIKTSIEESGPQFVYPNKRIYQSTIVFPDKMVEIIEEGFFGIDHLVAISICPFQYIPKTGKMKLVTKMEIKLILENAKQTSLLRKSVSDVSIYLHDSLVKLLVENDDDIYHYRTDLGSHENVIMNQNSGYSTQYLIITNENLAPAFEPLREHRTRLGMPAEIVLVSDINESSWGEDIQAKIRNYIINRYSTDDIDFVLLGGNESIVPIRYAYYYNTNVPKTPQEMEVCDLYYSDLTGDWDVDGDGIYGEPSHDDPDIYPEVYVGRIPASTPDQVTNWFNKLMTFEMYPSRGYLYSGDGEPDSNSNEHPGSFIPNQGMMNNFDHLTKTLFIAADEMTNQPALVATVFPDYFFCDIESCVEYPSGSHPNPTSPYGNEVIEVMNQGWQFINVFAHGNPDNYKCLAGNAVRSYVWGDRERLDGSIIQGHDGALTDLISYCPTITYSISCGNARIDYNTWLDYRRGRSSRCVGTAAVLMPERSDVAYMGNSRHGWVSTSYRMMKSFYQLVFDQQTHEPSIWPDNYRASLRIGILHAIHKVLNPTYRDLIYGHLLLGDPAMRVWSCYPKMFNVSIRKGNSASLDPFIPENVTISTGVPGSLICMRFPAQNFYEIREADVNGEAVFVTNFTREGSVRFTVTAPNYIPYEGSWWVYIPDPTN